MIECQICFVEYDDKNTFQLPNCLHQFCKSCLSEQFKTKIENQSIDLSDFKCPGCNQQFNPEITAKFLSPQLFEKYCQYALQLNKIFGLEDDEIMMNCLNDKCKMQFVLWKDAEYMTCPSCNTKFCRKCNLKYHQDQGISCEQQKLLHVDKEYLEMKKNLKVCRCPKCRNLCEKISGCNFMYCRCKATFCFLCDVELSEKYHCSHFQKNDPYASPCKIWYNDDWVEPDKVPKDYVPPKQEIKKPAAMVQLPIDNPIPCPNCKNTKSATSLLVYFDKVVICKTVKCANSAFCVICSKKVQVGKFEEHFDAQLQCVYKK